MTNIHTFEMSNSVELASAHDATTERPWISEPTSHSEQSDAVILPPLKESSFFDMLMMVWRATVAQAKLNSELPWCLLPT